MSPDELAACLTAAWNAGDAAAFAACFAPNADFIHIMGGHGAGRPGIEAAHRQVFATVYQGSRAEFEVAKLRPLGPDTLAVLMTQSVTLDQDGAAPVIRCRPTAVLQRGGEGWLIALMQNTMAPAPADVGERLAARHPFRPDAA